MSSSDRVSYPSLRNRVAFITGGATGIGASIVEAFCRQGSKVSFVDVQQQAGDALADRLERDIGVRPLFIPCDLRSIDALRQAIEDTRQQLGSIGILINNAADDSRTDIKDVTPDRWDDQMAVNLRPSFFAAQAVHPQMKALGSGSIINFGSICWSMKKGQMQAYAASKAAMSGLTRSLAGDFGPDGIRVNTLVPGWVMTERQLQDYVDEQTEEWIVEAQCIKRRLLPEHVADMALFLASDNSAMISAQDFVVDGGLA